jgi:hypothetical protein
MKTKCKNGNTVDSWYDRHSRNHITQNLDTNGNQIEDAELDGDKIGRNYSHSRMVERNGGKRKIIKLSGNLRVLEIQNAE